jgi:hypothetical protein
LCLIAGRYFWLIVWCSVPNISCIYKTRARSGLLTLPEHLSSPPVFSGVRVTRSLVLCVCFVDRCLSFCTFFYHCVVCSLISGFWLPFDIFKLFNNIINYTEMREECHNRGSNLCLSLEKHTVLVEANLASSSTWC